MASMSFAVAFSAWMVSLLGVVAVIPLVWVSYFPAPMIRQSASVPGVTPVSRKLGFDVELLYVVDRSLFCGRAQSLWIRPLPDRGRDEEAY
ncbi:hypothetical protein [Streptomyces cyaneofuscatus]|uniref:hypothetical protein n=1 Tax=Streptomyces cyaneofuscatus TaxID=66883 RepID=UPI0033BB8ED7